MVGGPPPRRDSPTPNSKGCWKNFWNRSINKEVRFSGGEGCVFFQKDWGEHTHPKKPNFFVYGPISKILSTSLRVSGGGVSAGGGGTPHPPQKKFLKNFFFSFFFKLYTNVAREPLNQSVWNQNH